MTNSLDFRNIRTHNGSQENGFEELVCQLAHLQPPENDAYFVRKEGAGGDAGVECFWKLTDGTEHAWQAKFFLDKLTPAQWSQIDGSVNTALEKHPELTKYYICIPRDRNDSRRRSNNKPVETDLDIWNKHKLKWEQKASERGMSVEFIYWGDHDISMLLQQDLPIYSGRVKYWFNSTILNLEKFKGCARISEQSLGERYSSENNVNLPISKIFDGLGLTKQWWEDVQDNFAQWNKELDLSDIYLKEIYSLLSLNVAELKDLIKEIKKKLDFDINQKILTENLNEHISVFDNLTSRLYEILKNYQELAPEKDDKEKSKKIEHIRSLDKLIDQTNDLCFFLKSEASQAAQTKKILLIGEAGIGKSHLLCDISLKRLENSLPTLFLLGQHYTGGDPIEFLKSSLDVSRIGNQQFLAAIDSIGEANHSQTLIIIDAINEGESRNGWKSFLIRFLKEIENFKHISIVLSCRDTYVDYILPEEYKTHIIDVTHHGFKGSINKYVSEYLNHREVIKPSIPILNPEFSNPLFLKTCCDAIKMEGGNSFPKGLQGITGLLDFYINSLERKISRIKEVSNNRNIVRRVIEKISLELYPDHLFGIPLEKAETIINGFDPAPNKGDSLYSIFYKENIISEDILYNKEGFKSGIPVVRFTYERFSDYFIALSLIKDLGDTCLLKLKKAFSVDEKLYPLINFDNYIRRSGILWALAIIIPEKYKTELKEIISGGLSDSYLNNLFIDTVKWRSKKSFTDKTNDWLNNLGRRWFQIEAYNIIISLSTEPDHPWNAEKLHRRLISQTLPERDRSWTLHIALSDYETDDDYDESPIRSIIEWSYSAPMEGVEEERIRLSAILLMWLTTSSNRRTRDHATKAAVRILSFAPNLLLGLLEKFKTINDPYVKERLYAVVYGVTTQSNDLNAITDVSNWIWEAEFEGGNPTQNILIRDYARGIMEFAFFMNLIAPSIPVDSFRPPYTSNWPLDIPSDSELEKLFGPSHDTKIRASVMGFVNDFGRYTMSRIHNWSPTPLTSDSPQDSKELQLEFANKHLDQDLEKQLINYISEKDKVTSWPLDEKYIAELLEKQDSESGGNADGIRSLLKSERSKTEQIYKELSNVIRENLDEKGKEEFRWLMGLRRGYPGTFSRKAAQRWVCKRAFDLGWRKEYFDEFEKAYCQNKDRSEATLERIGKKYQWIALYEFIAHLADNCQYIDQGNNEEDSSQYHGPWQINKRNIDPTYSLRQTRASNSMEDLSNAWWKPNNDGIYGSSVNELKAWLSNNSSFPDLAETLLVADKNNRKWYVLNSSFNRRKEVSDLIQYQWLSITAGVIKKSDIEALKQIFTAEVTDDDLIDRENQLPWQGYIFEYPWHPIYNDVNNLSQCEHGIKILKLFSTYSFEGALDNESISLMLPTKTLIDAMELTHSKGQIGTWKNKQGETIFIDPCIDEEGPSSALCDKNELDNWMIQNDYQLIWQIRGEKQLYDENHSNNYGAIQFNALYSLVDGNIEEIGFHEDSRLEN